MEEKYITYKLGDRIFDVPESQSADIEKKYPDVTIEMRMNDRVFDVPLSSKDSIIEKYGSNISYSFDRESPDDVAGDLQPAYAQEETVVTDTIPTEAPKKSWVQRVVDKAMVSGKSNIQDDENENDIYSNILNSYKENSQKVTEYIDRKQKEYKAKPRKPLKWYEKIGASGSVLTMHTHGLGGSVYNQYKKEVADMGVQDALIAHNIYKKTEKKVNQYLDPANTFVEGALQGIGDAVTDIETWDSFIGAENAARIYTISKKTEKGEALTEGEQMIVDALVDDMAVDIYMASGFGRGYKAGNVTGESIPFMIETAFNPASGAGKAVAKKFGKTIFKKVYKKLGSMTAKAAVGVTRVATDAAGAAVMSATSSQARVVEDAFNRLSGEVSFNANEDGTLDFAGFVDNEDSAFKAYAKAFGANTIEHFSEMVGNYFAPIGKMTQKGAGRLADKIGLSKINELLTGMTPNGFGSLVKDFAEQTQWHGTIGEFAEEMIGGALNALTVEDQTLKKYDENGNLNSNYLFDKDNIIDTFLGVSILGGVMSASKTIGYTTHDTRYNREITKAKNGLNGIVSEEEIGMLEAFALNPMGADYANLEPFFDESRSQESKEAVAKYLSAVMQKQGYNIAREADLSGTQQGMNEMRNAWKLGQNMTEADLYDVNEAEEQAKQSLIDTGVFDAVEGSTDSFLPQDVLGYSSYDLYNLSERSDWDFTEEQRAAIKNLAIARNAREGLYNKLDSITKSAITSYNTIANNASSNGTITIGLHNGQKVYIKGDVTVSNGVIEKPSDTSGYPVAIVDANTGEASTIDSSELSDVFNGNIDEYNAVMSNVITNEFQQRYDSWKNTKSAKSKLAEIQQYVGEKVFISTANNDMAEVEVQQILPNGEVLIKGKKGDLGGQSNIRVDVDSFYDSMSRDANGNPIFNQAKFNSQTQRITEAQKRMNDQEPSSSPSDIEQNNVSPRNADYRDQTATVLINGVPTEVYVISQDNASDSIVYEYTDENGKTKRGSSTIGAFQQAIQQAEEYEPEQPVLPTEPVPSEGATETGPTEAPVENTTLDPESINWDELFNQDQEAYFAELQNQFGEEAIDVLNDEIAATQAELDALNKAKTTSQNERIANRGKKKALQAKLDALNGMASRLTSVPATETPAVTPDGQPAAGEPASQNDVLEAPQGEAPAHEFVIENGRVTNPIVLEQPGAQGTPNRIFLAEKDGKWGFAQHAVLDDGNESGSANSTIQVENLRYNSKEEAIAAALSYFDSYKNYKKDSPSTALDSFVQYIRSTYLSGTAPSGQTENVPDVSADRASDARARGFRMTNGQRIDRRGETAGTYGNEIGIAFTADSKGKRNGRVKVIDAGSLVPSHIGGTENVEHFLPEAQPKKRTDKASTVSASLIAQNMNNPQMTTVTTSAYEGAPIVNKRGEVIQGNNRSAALLEMYQSHGAKAAEYKQYLIDHAADFGLDANEIAAMQNPVLVRELDVDDADAINLGQYTMQDMESGGSQMIDSGRSIAGLSNKGLLEDFITRLLAEENEETSDMNLSDLITRNGNEALKMLYQNGIINQTQYQSALGANGRITADARAALRGIIEHQLFADGIDNLSVMFEILPDKAKKAIMQTISRDLKNPDDARVTPYIQEAIEIYYQLNQQPDFVAAKTKEEVENAVELFKGQTSLEEDGTPAEKYSNFAFDLAKKFKTLTLKQQRDLLNRLYEVIAGEVNIFGESEGKSLADAVAEVYDTNLNKGNNETNGQSGAAVLEGGNGGRQEGQQGSTGNVGVRPETGEGGQRTSDGGTDTPVFGSTAGQAAGEVTPSAPTQVANPIDEARKKERQLALNLKKVGLSPEAKQDLAFNAGKAVADMFATREEYDVYAETATDFGLYNADFERGVEESFANRQQNAGNSPVNSVPLETEPKGENNGEQGETDGTSGNGPSISDNSGRTDNTGTEGGDKTSPKIGKGKTGKGADGKKVADKYPARKGNATQKLLEDTFGFNKVEIPNSRKETLNTIYDFMMAMSKMLGISPKSIGQGGWLDVGNLRSNAQSSAEHSLLSKVVDQSVVKATIKYKYSTLRGIAHEWWHALDHALSYFETGKGKTTASEIVESKFTGRKETWEAVRQVIKAIKESGHESRMFTLGFPRRYSDYLVEPTEMAARAFDEYIKAKFADAGIVIQNSEVTDFVAQPTPEEMEVIAPAFENLFKVLKEKAGKTVGTSVLYHIGEEMQPQSDAKRLATDAVLTALDESNIETERLNDEQTEQYLKQIGADSETQFSIDTDKPIFLSNAAIAVMGIKQEKATPEQWLKMIEKNGGLKAGEDKWMGLSDWLKASDKKTLTKAEVLDFINENTIRIEEVNYGEIDYFAEDKKLIDAINGEFLALRKEAQEAGEFINDAGDIAYEQMIEKYGDDFSIAFGVDLGELYVSNREAASVITGVDLGAEREINETRLGYTTDGLDNKKEIALIVPTIERWNQHDEVHFGDAGDGRAVAWVRFGETEVTVQDETQQRLNEIYERLDELEMKVSSTGITEEEYNERARLRTERDELQEIKPKTQRVLVIDEIQSKRHQEGREKGYNNEFVYRNSTIGEYSKYDEDQDVADIISAEGRVIGKMFRSSVGFAAENTDGTQMTSLRNSEAEALSAMDNAFNNYGIPDAPFDKNWHELAMKRMLRYAAEEGYDVIAWTKGEQQAERYNIGNVVEYIDVAPYEAENSSEVNGFDVNIATGSMATLDLYVTESGEIASGQYGPEDLVGKQLSDVVGKDLAAKILSTDRNENSVRYEGDDFRIGGEGMKGFYDKMLPAFMNKYGKKWGVKVADITLPNVEDVGRVMHSVPVTDAMKESVTEGQPMFMKRPNGTVYGWTDGKKIYLTEAGINPNTPVHEYTHLWAKAMMQKNPKGWQSVKDLLRGTPVWNEVLNDPNYSSIHSNEDLVASEVLSRISGTQNAAKLEQMAQQMIDEAKGTVRKLEARGLIQNIKDALNKFWNWVGTELFGIENFESVEQITDRVLWDLMNKTDLGELSEGQVETQIVTDPKVIAELEASPKRTGYRNVVQNEDGSFSSPMAYWLQSTKGGAKTRVETAKFELGKWEEAEEHPDLVDENGKVTLVKPNKKTVDNVAYDPYIHNRLEPVNLQFKDAWKREDLVYVETEVAENDLNDGYHADKALLPVGVHSWSNGAVMLSRYDKPVRIMPWEAVADAWVERLNGEGVHFDVVPPALRPLLVERGVEILPPHKGMGKDCNDAYSKWKNSISKENSVSLPNVSQAIESGVWNEDALKELDKITEDVEEGKAILKRYTSSELTGLLEGGRLLVGASILSRGSETDIRSPKSREDIQNAAVDFLVGEPRLRAIENSVNEEASKLGVTVTYKTRSEMPKGHQNDKGYYNTKTGEIVICTENATSIADAIQTILHEAVAHKGLRQLMGDKFDEFISRVYNSLDAETKAKVDALAAEQYGGNTAVAMEEYMASLAETENFAENSVWDKIKSIFENIINAILGRNDIKIGDNELRYILRASYNNMVNPRNMDTIRGWAQDQMMREDYKINHSSPEILSRTGIDPAEIASESARQVYDRVVSKGWQETQRQFQDAMQPVRIAIDAIQQETGNIPVEDYENYLLIQNQASSRSRVEIDNFQRKYYSPIVEQVNKIIDKILEARGLKNNKKNRAEIYKEVRQYLIAKHGLERNAYYQTHKQRLLNAEEKEQARLDIEANYSAELARIASTYKGTERANQENVAKQRYEAELAGVDSMTTFDVRDYSGLTSLYGLEPNEFELAEAEAKETVSKFETEVDSYELWRAINAATDKTLRHSYECGLLSRSQYEDIKSMFRFYIPLRGFDETTAEDVYAYARFEGNRFNSVLQKAQGRTSVADDPIATIMNMAESEIAQGNKNRAKQALYNFILNRPVIGENGIAKQNSLMQVEDVWYVKGLDSEGQEIYQIAAPNHEAGESWEEFESRMASLEAEEKAFKSKKGKMDIGLRFQKKTNRNAHYIYLKINGVDKAIYINGDPKAADAVNGTYQQQKSLAESKFRQLNRFISSTFTNYSLEFTARNFFRDMIYSHINMGIREKDFAYRRTFRKNWRRTNIISMLKMLNAYRAGEYDGAELTGVEKAFFEFMNNGGQTGYTLINSVESKKKDLERAISRMRKGVEKGGVRDSAAFKYTLGWIELLNEASELVTRFAAFKTSRDMGRDIITAINDAKEITVNFNTKGAQDGTGWRGAVAKYFGWSKYFFNASVQGVQNTKAMAEANKLKFCSVVGGMAGLGFCMPLLTAAIAGIFGGDDDEEYWNIPEYERQNNLCFVIGGGQYIKIPLPIGFREVYAIGDMVASMAFNKKFTQDIGTVGTDIANKIASVILPINPLESTANGLSIWHTLAYAAAPSSAQVVIQNMTNTDWKGAPLQKEYGNNKNDPQWMKAFASNPEWMTGLAKWCNEHIDLDGDYKGMDWSPEKLDNTLSNIFGGVYTLIKKTGKGISSAWNEEERNLSNLPLVSVLVGSGIDSDDRFITNTYYEIKKDYDENVNLIERRAKMFGYSLEEVFKEKKGAHQPKMQEIYDNDNFDWMAKWYLGNKELDDIKKDIQKLEKKIGADEPDVLQAEKMTKLNNSYEDARRKLVNEIMEMD